MSNSTIALLASLVVWRPRVRINEYGALADNHPAGGR